MLSLTLIGILLLSGVLYYRAVKIQRFLEPALAIVQPRNEFTQKINHLLAEEFGEDKNTEVKFSAGSIIIGESLLFDRSGNMKKSAYAILQRLGRIFISVLNDRNMRYYIDIILVSTKFHGTGLDNPVRLRAQRKAESILYSLYRTAPQLEKEHGKYFAATAISASSEKKDISRIEFMIIPTELLHIEALQRLGKYAD